MNAIQIEFDLDELLFYGNNNNNFDIIKNNFSDLKITGRGNTIIAKGKDTDLNIFSKKINEIFHFAKKYNRLSKIEIEQILADSSLSKNNKVLVSGVFGSQIKARTLGQKKMAEEILKKDMMFVYGPAGTGKTYTAVALAVNALKSKTVKKIILVRPAVEAGESLGFLPGDYKEKLDPYLQPLYDALGDMIAKEKLSGYFEYNTIEIVPLAFMRGRTLDNAFVILDEAQNTTPVQMKMFLTRMGKHSKFVITGDEKQIDLPRNTKSGLIDAIEKLKNIKEIGFIKMNENDVMRHPIVKKIIKSYDEK